MTLITIVFAVILEFFLGSLSDLRRFGVVQRLVDGFARKAGSGVLAGPAGVVLLLVVCLLPVYLILGWLMGLSVVVAFLLSLAVLVYCLGPRPLTGVADEFELARQAGDEEKALWYAEQLLGRPLGEQERADLEATVSEAVLVAANDRWFGVLFWFAVLGPFGALLFRLSSQFRAWAMTAEKADETGSLATAIHRVHDVIAWLPARLLMLAFALVGNFAPAIAACCQGGETRVRWAEAGEALLARAGLAALQGVAGGETAVAAQRLVTRSLWLWLAVIALLNVMWILL